MHGTHSLLFEKMHLNGANLVERFDGANAAVHAKDALVEDGGDRQVVKQRLVEWARWSIERQWER